MIKALLLIVLLVGACYVAMMVWQRLVDTQQKLASLHDEMRRNDLKLESEITKLNQQTESQPTEESQQH